MRARRKDKNEGKSDPISSSMLAQIDRNLTDVINQHYEAQSEVDSPQRQRRSPTVESRASSSPLVRRLRKRSPQVAGFDDDGLTPGTIGLEPQPDEEDSLRQSLADISRQPAFPLLSPHRLPSLHMGYTLSSSQRRTRSGSPSPEAMPTHRHVGSEEEMTPDSSSPARAQSRTSKKQRTGDPPPRPRSEPGYRPSSGCGQQERPDQNRHSEIRCLFVSNLFTEETRKLKSQFSELMTSVKDLGKEQGSYKTAQDNKHDDLMRDLNSKVTDFATTQSNNARIIRLDNNAKHNEILARQQALLGQLDISRKETVNLNRLFAENNMSDEGTERR